MEATYYVEKGSRAMKRIVERDMTRERADALQRQIGGRVRRHKGPEQPGHAHNRNTGGALVGKDWF